MADYIPLSDPTSIIGISSPTTTGSVGVTPADAGAGPLRAPATNQKSSQVQAASPNQTATQAQPVVSGPPYFVRLVSAVSGAVVTFNASPDVTEHRQANYKPQELVHLPGSIQMYTNTPSRTFDISTIKLFSRTTEEATINMNNLWVLRSWLMPNFGTGNGASGEIIGAPPEVLYLYAFSSVNSGSRNNPTNINKVPVVMSTLNIPYSSDGDFISTTNGDPFPRLMTISMTLVEAQSPQSLSNFSLAKYKAGTLDGF